MNRRRWLLSLVAVLTFTALTVYETEMVARRRSEQATVESALRQMSEELTTLRTTHGKNLHDLSAARQQLDDLTTLIKPALAAGEPAREIEVQAWLARVKQLRELLAQNPDQHIPELSLLTEADWLRASRKINLGDDDQRRQALAALRGVAKEKFTRNLADALTKFTAAHNGALPTEIGELTPYFSSRPDPGMLLRYAVTSQPRKSAALIQEKSAVDPDYDTRPTIHAKDGFGSASAPEAWIDNFSELRAGAIEAYRKDNNGAFSQKFADLIPYMNPPLPPATVEKLLAAERKRGR